MNANQRRHGAAQQRLVDAWNTDHPDVGIPVLLRKDTGAPVLTKTRSRAELLSGHTAVIWLEGVSGCYGLDRVTPAPVAAGEPA